MAKDTEKLENQLAEAKKENDLLTKAQQELKAKVKELTDIPPKIISGHVTGKIKYIRQERVK